MATYTSVDIGPLASDYMLQNLSFVVGFTGVSVPIPPEVTSELLEVGGIVIFAS